MENDHEKLNQFSWRRLSIVVIFVLFSAIVICGLIYWRLNNVIKIQNEEIKTLTNQINSTSEKIRGL